MMCSAVSSQNISLSKLLLYHIFPKTFLRFYMPSSPDQFPPCLFNNLGKGVVIVIFWLSNMKSNSDYLFSL